MSHSSHVCCYVCALSVKKGASVRGLGTAGIQHPQGKGLGRRPMGGGGSGALPLATPVSCLCQRSHSSHVCALSVKLFHYKLYCHTYSKSSTVKLKKV